MNINQNINKLLYALSLENKIYKINSFRFYNNKDCKYNTKYQIMKKIKERRYNLEIHDFEVIERYKQDYECYSKVEVMKYLVEEYYKGSDTNE